MRPPPVVVSRLAKRALWIRARTAVFARRLTPNKAIRAFALRASLERVAKRSEKPVIPVKRLLPLPSSLIFGRLITTLKISDIVTDISTPPLASIHWVNATNCRKFVFLTTFKNDRRVPIIETKLGSWSWTNKHFFIVYCWVQERVAVDDVSTRKEVSNVTVRSAKQARTASTTLSFTSLPSATDRLWPTPRPRKPCCESESSLT